MQQTSETRRIVGFLDLSLELRTLIYECVFRHEKALHKPARRDGNNVIVPEVALLLLNRQVCSEAKDMIYHNNNVLIKMQQLRSHSCASSMPTVEGCKLQYVQIAYENNRPPFDRVPATRLLAFCDGLSRLRSATVVFDNISSWHVILKEMQQYCAGRPAAEMTRLESRNVGVVQLVGHHPSIEFQLAGLAHVWHCAAKGVDVRERY